MNRLFQVVPILLLLVCSSLRAAVQVGDKLHLSLTTTNGMRITTPELKGHLLVVDFWATWCHPCMMQVPDIVKTYKKYHGDGVGFVGVSLDDDLGQLQSVARAHGIVWPQVFQGQDWQDPIAKAWGVRAIPVTFLLGPDGTVLWTGYPTGLRDAIKAALKKYPTQVMLDRKSLQTITGATRILQRKHNYLLALKTLAALPAKMESSRILRRPARILILAFYHTGKPAVAALLADTTLSKKHAVLVGGMGHLRSLLRGYNY